MAVQAHVNNNNENKFLLRSLSVKKRKEKEI